MQTFPTKLNDFLGVRTGGRQIDELKSTISPVLDVGRFMYPITAQQGTFSTSGTNTNYIANASGAGTYKISLIYAGCIQNGLTAGFVTLNTAPQVSAGIIYGINAFAVASAVLNFAGGQIDAEFEMTDGEHLAISSSAPAGLTNLSIKYSVTMQRVK